MIREQPTAVARVVHATRQARELERCALRRYVSSCLLSAALCLSACAATSAELERSGGPFVPTPQIVVDEMLRMGNVGPKDFIIDLGSGDGVIVLTAAREHKARGMGFDID